MQNILKIYKKDILAISIICISFIISSFLAISSYKNFLSFKKEQEILKEKQRTYKEILKIFSKYQALKKKFHNFQAHRKVEIKQIINIDPLEKTLSKIESIYIKNGFFFLEEAKLQKCEEKKQDKEIEKNCMPRLFISGEKDIF